MAVDVVAVSAEPMKWQAYCEECDKYVSDVTEDDKFAQKKGLVHLAQAHVDHSKVEII